MEKFLQGSIPTTALAIIIICCAHLWMSYEDEQEQIREAAHRQETIEAAKAKFRKQQEQAKLKGLQDDANRMMYPCCQATTGEK